jgi:hypothetical protein
MALPLLKLEKEVRVAIDGGSWRAIIKELNAGFQADRLLKEVCFLHVA